MFVGFALHLKAKLVYVPERNTVFITQSVYLDRDEFPITEALQTERLKEKLNKLPHAGACQLWNEGIRDFREEDLSKQQLELGDDKRECLLERLWGKNKYD